MRGHPIPDHGRGAPGRRGNGSAITNNNRHFSPLLRLGLSPNPSPHAHNFHRFSNVSSSAMATLASFPECMKGKHVNVFLPSYDCVVKVFETTEDEFLVKFHVDRRLVPGLSVDERIVLEGHGYRLDCLVALVEEVLQEAEQLRISVRALNSDETHCDACWGISVSTDKGHWDGRGMRFCRLDRHTVHEAVVQDVKRQESFLEGVHLKFLSAPPPLNMGDLLVLESMDGRCQWEANVKCHGDLMFYKGGNDQIYLESVIVHVDDRKGSKLLRQFQQIFVLPASNLTYFPPGNVMWAGLKQTNKARRDEAANSKIKIGINGYGSIARTMIKIALDSQDLELVAINDPLLASIDKKTCMFGRCNPHQGWRSDIKMKNSNTLMFDEKEVTLFRIIDRCQVPWNMTGAEYIVEAYDYDDDTDYKEVKLIEKRYTHYIPNVSPLKNCLSPLAKVLCDKFGTVEDMSSVGRVPVLIHIEPEKDPDAAAAIVKVLPQWKGKPSGLIFQFPTIDARSINIGIQIAEYKDGDWILSNARPSNRFNVLFAWCVEMARQIPEVMYCKLKFK